jgi:hypothetical protein
MTGCCKVKGGDGNGDGAQEQLFLLQNVATWGPFVVPVGGVLFDWDSPPLIDDAGDWSRTTSTDITCNRAGRYRCRFAIYGNTQPGDPPAYFAAFADLDALFLDAAVSQWDLMGANQAATFQASWYIPAATVGQVLRVQLLAFSLGLSPSWLAGAGAQLEIVRKR